MKKTEFKQFKQDAKVLLDRLAEVRAVFNEANELFDTLEFDDLTDDQQDDISDLGYDIAHAGNFSFNGQGFWLPSTC